MSLLGIDVGTTGCKAVVFSMDGRIIASAYKEYDVQRLRPGYAELNAFQVWQDVKTIIKIANNNTKSDPIQALAVSSLGEAVVPVKLDRQVLWPSLLNFDQRGDEFIPGLSEILGDDHLYQINGNTLGNHFSLTKLLWLKTYQPELYEQTDLFLHWSGFVSFMLGADPVVDYSLANRTLLFDLDHANWSDHLINQVNLDRAKLPQLVPAGTPIGYVSSIVARELGLPESITIVAGAHDQCANALGCGVVHEGQAMYGMGTYICITPVFQKRIDAKMMIARGLNTEHHAIPGLFVSFIYTPGGALVKWYRDTFAAAEKKHVNEHGGDLYTDLFSEIPLEPSELLVLPHFAPTGPPDFISDSSGVLIGLTLETKRGDILKSILEGTTFYMKECVDLLPETGIRIDNFRAVGGGSKSDSWLQICADILGKPFIRPDVTEAGTLGAAILAGKGKAIFPDVLAGVEGMVKLDHYFEPDAKRSERYTHRYEQYQQVWPLMKKFLKSL